MVLGNRIVHWLATRRKDNMYVLTCKLNTDCELLVTSRKQVKSRVWLFLALYCRFYCLGLVHCCFGISNDNNTNLAEKCAPLFPSHLVLLRNIASGAALPGR